MINNKYIALGIFLVLAVFVSTVAATQLQQSSILPAQRITTTRTTTTIRHTTTTTVRTTSTTTTSTSATTTIGSSLYWAKNYVETKTNYQVDAQSISPTSNNGYIVGGVESSLNSSSVVILKLDSSGNIQWQKTFTVNGTQGQEISDIRQTSDGGYIFVGVDSFGSPFGNSQCNSNWERACTWIAKLNSNGTLQWTYSFAGYYTSSGYDILQTANGSYIAVGSTASTDAGGATWVADLSSSGNLVWQKYIGYPGNENSDIIGQIITATSDGNYIISSTYGGIPGQSTLITKITPSGNMLWQKTYGKNYELDVSSIVSTSDGGYLLAGTSSYPQGPNEGYASILAVKLDSNGNIQWEKLYWPGDLSCGGEGTASASSAAQTSNNDYVLGGTISYCENGGRFIYAYLLGTSSNGTVLWQHAYGNQSGSGFESSSIGSNGSITSTGWNIPIGGSGNDELYTVKTNSIAGFNSNCKDLLNFYTAANPGVYLEPINLNTTSVILPANSTTSNGAIPTTVTSAIENLKVVSDC